MDLIHEDDSEGIEEYNNLLAITKGDLPFLKKVIDCSDYLGIRKQHLEKLHSLYLMLDQKKLSISKLRSCQKVVCNLYNKYHNLLKEYDEIDSENLNQWDECENKPKSSEMKSTSNKDDLKLCSKSEISSNVVTSSENLIVNNQLDESVDHDLIRMKNSVFEKSSEHIKNNKSSTSENLNKDNDSMLPEFSDSRLRLNKLIGFAANASIEKLNTIDRSVSNAEIAKQVFNEIAKQSKNKVICQNMLKDINMDAIDVNHVKQVIESIKNMEPVHPPPLPQVNLLDFGKTQFELSLSVDPNNDNLPLVAKPQSQSTVNLVPNKSSTIRDKLNNDMNMFHKIGSSSEPKQKFISALKPGTLIDLENSKVARSSLLMESIRTVPSNEKNSDIKQFLPPIVARDPRIRNKSLLNPENINSPGQTHLQTNVHQLIPSLIQNSGSISNPSHLSPNINHIPNLGSQQELSHIALSVYNGQANYPMPSNYTIIQPFGNLSPTEQNERLNQSVYINCRPSALNQYRIIRNDYTSIDNQHSVPNLLHINTITHNEPIMNNHDPVLPNTYKCRNDLIAKRDPRSMKDRLFDRKIHEPQYRNFKEYREAKYGKEKYSNSSHRKNNMDNNLEQHRHRNFNLDNEKCNPYNHSGVINDSDGIKNFKIPKIKRDEELVSKNLTNDTTEEALEIENIEDDNLNRDTRVDTIEANDNKKTVNINVEKKVNVEIVKDDEEKKQKTDESQEIKVKNSTIIIDDDKKDIESKQCNISKESTDESTNAKQPKKCTKEKEFENIVKDAAANLNGDECGPRIRTRSSLKKIEETIKKRNKSLDLGECSKSIKHGETSIGETGQDVISSTSKEPSEVGTPIEGECKSLEENTVSSNVVNSTVDAKTNQLIPSSIFDLQNPGLLTLIEILQDEQKRLKLQEFLNATDTTKSTKEDEPKTKYTSHQEYSDFDKQKKLRRKMKKKEKKLRKKMNKTFVVDDLSNDEEDNNAYLNNDNYSMDENSNNDSMAMDNSNDGNSSSESNDNSSTGQGKVKSSKRKKYKENYGNFEIKDKNLFNTTELKDLKIVIAKYDKKNKNSETPVEVHTPSVPTPQETSVNLKPKKPFLAPLSVKLTRDKLETDQNNSNNVLDGNNQLEIKPNNEIISNGKAKKSCKSKNKRVKTNVAKKSSLLIESQETDPIVQISTPVNMPLDDEHGINDQNNKEIIPIKPNVDIKTDIKKSRPKMTELDKLHADISEMYDCDAVLNAPSIRHCRQNKQINYVNNNTAAMSKKNRTSNIDQSNDQIDEVSGELSKTPLGKKNKSKLKINKKVCISKKDNTMNIVPHNTVNSTLNKKVTGSKKTKKIVKSHDKSELSNLSLNYNAETVEVKTTNVLTENNFKDRSHFQTSDNVLECQFCSYNGTGLNIVRHYKEQHSKEEVLSSRLSINCAEILINESLKEHYGLLDVQDLKPLKDIKPMDINFTCVFCQAIIYGTTTFYDHITSHTGEYRYMCKVCPKIYQSESELEKHTLEHSNYDKSEGISNLLHSNPAGCNKIFGYLCPFCYYIQLDYHKIVNHLTAQHFDDDKKYNGHWTVIRVNMSIGDDNYTSSIIDYSNLVGCLPPIINDNVISKDVNKKYPINETSVSTLVAQKKKAMKDAASLELQIFNDDKLDSPNLNFSPVEVIPSSKEDTTKIDDDLILEHQEYTLKGNSIKCTMAGLSCELKNSILLYKCSVSKCQNNQFSTVVLIDFLKHINLNHQQIVWDRKCDICEHAVEKINNKQYILKDALHHIISYHLVLKEIQQPNISNFENMEKEQNSSSIDSVSNKEIEPIKVHSPPRIRSPLRVRCDLYSTANDENRQQMAENMLNRLEFDPQDSKSIEDTEIDVVGNTDTEDCTVDNSEQPPSPIVLVNPFETSVEETNMIQMSNTTIPPISPASSFLCIKDVRSLKKRGTVSVDKYNRYEIISPNPHVHLDSGQQIVNNGTPINGTYCTIDTFYQKCYLKKIRKLPMNVMKTRLAFKDMTSIPKLLGLFKCMDRTCTKIFNDKELFKLHMQLHFSNTEKKKKNHFYNTEQFKHCVYCFRKFDNAESLATHISEKYSFCKYFCPFCFYRAYSPCHVLVHQSIIHPNYKTKIIQLDCDESPSNNTGELLLAVDYNNFILPYTCNVGRCSFFCYVPSDFISHLSQDHQQCDKFCCYICANQDNGKGFIALQPKLMIKHFILHNINVYQCIFCVFGSELIESMMSHLAMEHFEYEPLCLERTLMSGKTDSTAIENLTIIRLKKSIFNGELEIVNLPPEIISLPETQRNKRRRLECPDVLSAAMKSACIEESTQSSDTIVITVPDRAHMVDNSNSSAPAIDNEFIMLDDNDQNDLRESLRINDIWTENENNVVEPLEQPDDVITIDDEDDLPDTSNKTVATEISIKRKHSVLQESFDSRNKNKRLALPIIALDKLFLCKECDLVFSNGKDYQQHLNNCSYWNPNHAQPCVFCSKSFKTAFNMTEHLKLHGPDRFICNLCNFNAPSRRAIGHHMKMMHNLIELEFVPVRAKFTNIDIDEFIVYEDKEQKTPKKPIGYTCGECGLTSVERKSIVLHMRDVHKIDKYETCLVNYPHNKHFLEEYVIKKIDPPVDLQSSAKQMPIKRKHPDNYLINNSNKKDSTKPTFIAEDEKVLSFSPNTVDHIPKMHIFSNPIGCSLCTYKTKVRSNLIIHLDGHKKGQDNTTKEIVNPVPSIGKSELMFDKMINLSASSFEAMNSEKMKIDLLNMKIVEVFSTDDLDIELYPPFIPKIKRFQCSEGTCNQQFFSDEDLLKTHMSIIHKDFQFYLCPHCPPNSITTKEVKINNIAFHLMYHTENLYKCQYCDYIDFNRDEMRKHMRLVHLSLLANENQSNIIIIRQSKLKDYSIERHIIQAQPPVIQWTCNMCTSRLQFTDDEIMSHIVMLHQQSKMFKCPMCQFEHNDDSIKIFEEHFKHSHPSVAAKCMKVYEKFNDAEQNLVSTVTNNQEQQALESIEPLMPPTCRGIPLESITTTNKVNNKSRGVSKSPKSAKKSPLQTRKSKMFIDDFSENDNLGIISPRGQFVCPRCGIYETRNLESFRDHLYKDVNFKNWKCMKCFEISDSPKKMAWHVKKHGPGTKYEKIESIAKLKWVERVITHQQLLFTEFSKQNREKNVTYVEQKNTIADKNVTARKRTVLNNSSVIPQMSSEIIDLLDDSDTE